VVLSHLLTEPSNSLIHQSFHSEEREEPLNGDGFGVAWYVPQLTHHPGTFRSITPAWSNRNLAHLAQVTASGCVLAHVRAASESLTVSESNCHPFVHGPFTFMHNGDVAGYRTQRRACMASLSDASYSIIEGTTDSEYLFGLFLDGWHDAHTETRPAERMAKALTQCIEKAIAIAPPVEGGEVSYLNIAVSDGLHAVVSRYTNGPTRYAESLHMHRGKTYRCIDGVCVMHAPEDGRGAVVVSSEKLSDDPDWETIAPNTLVVVHNDRQVSLRPLAVGSKA
jgi:glutamine amidotransferase